MDFEITIGRVSLITPCFNVEMYFADFLNSIRAQTYKNLEVILVNDGSNLATTQLLRDAVEPLEADGYLVKLIEQENKGLGGAVDTGLKYFTGEFLMWPDPDDWLLAHSIERRVEIMRANPDVGLLRTNARLFIEAKKEFDGNFMPVDRPNRIALDLFENLIFNRHFMAPVCHIVRSEMFLNVHPSRSIYFSPFSSQNYQLLVPMVEAYQVLQVHEPLACYRVREDSRSRSTKTDDSRMRRYDQIFDLVIHTLPKLKTYRIESFEIVQNFHWRERILRTAFRSGMEDRLHIIQYTNLSQHRKALAMAMMRVRCHRAFRKLDGATKKTLSKVLARLFDFTIRMSKEDLIWGADPLWKGAYQDGINRKGRMG